MRDTYRCISLSSVVKGAIDKVGDGDFKTTLPAYEVNKVDVSAIDAIYSDGTIVRISFEQIHPVSEMSRAL